MIAKLVLFYDFEVPISKNVIKTNGFLTFWNSKMQNIIEKLMVFYDFEVSISNNAINTNGFLTFCNFKMHKWLKN